VFFYPNIRFFLNPWDPLLLLIAVIAVAMVVSKRRGSPARPGRAVSPPGRDPIDTLLAGLDRMERRVDNLETILGPERLDAHKGREGSAL
jgi:hypothetical protein